MTVNYTTLLGLAKPVTGTEQGDWGDVVNDEITTLLEDAVANSVSISVTAGDPPALTDTNGATNQARMSTLIITGSPGVTRNIVAPSRAKIYQVINQSNGAVVIKGTLTTGVTIAAGATGTVAWNGSDFIEIGSTSSGRTFNGNVTVNGVITAQAAATQDAVKLQGRAGGSSSYAVTITPTTLTANRTITAPDTALTLAGIDVAQTFTAVQTFTPAARTSGAASYFTLTTPADTGQTASTESIGASFTAATRTWATGGLTLQRERVFGAPTYAFAGASTLTTAINVDIGTPVAGSNATITNAWALRSGPSLFVGNVRAEAAATQDAVVVAGRAGGTSSYAVTITPTTLAANRTFTLPDATTVAAGLAVSQTFTGIQTFTPDARTSGASPYFVVTMPTDTGQTAGTESIGVSYTAGTRTWAGGTLALQRERVFAAPTYAFGGVSTLTTAINVDIATPVAGTNATITNAYALRAGASIFTGNVTLDGGTANGVVYLNASKVATTGSALTFDGTKLAVLSSSAATLGSLKSTSTTNQSVQLQIFNDNDTPLNIGVWGSSAGTLGILGASTPFVTTNASTLNFANTNASGAILWGLGASATEAMRLSGATGGVGALGIGYTSLTSVGDSGLAVLGKVGIGTNTPAKKLDIYSDSGTAAIKLQTSTNIAWSLNSQIPGVANNGFSIYDETNSVNRFVIDSSGNVGIGTSSPSGFLANKLVIATGGTANEGITIYSSSNNGSLWFADATTGTGRYAGGIDYQHSTNELIFYSNSQGNMRLDTSGNLGLGVTPSAWGSGFKAMQIGAAGVLVGQASAKTVELVLNAFHDGSSWKYLTTDKATQYYQYDGAHAWGTAASGTAGNAITFTQAMTLDTSGNLGVGETSPSTFGKVVSRGGTFSLVADTASQRRLSFWATANGNSENAYIQVQNDGLTTNTGEMLFATRNTSGTLTERARITSGGDLLVGNTSGASGARLSIQGTGSYNSTGWGSTLATVAIRSNEMNNNAWNPTLNIAMIRQSLTTGNASFGGIGFTTIDDSNNSGIDDAARIAVINESIGSLLSNTALAFYTNNSGSNTGAATERARITSGGYFKASNTGTYADSTGGYNEFYQTNNTDSVRVTSTSSAVSGAYGVYINLTADPNSTDSFFLRCYGDANQRASIRSNGGLANYQANDVNLSDARLKTDIAPVASYWDKIKSLEIVSFRYKDQTDDIANIGVIAQQVESVAPEFVSNDGFGEATEGEVPYKTIYTTDMYHAAIKALQEAMARIETLEAKIAVLESKGV